MDGATVQSRIYKGYGKASAVLGKRFNQYRASSYQNPVSVQNRIASPTVAFNAEDMKFSKPNKYGKPTWYALFDASTSKVGDYLVGPSDTFFIATLQPLLPILVVECNRTISVLRPQQQSGIGVAGYGGDTAANETPLMTAWPASILQGTKGEKNEVGLPGDTRTPWWSILLPYYAGVILKPSDIIADDIGRRYIISSPELTDLGWRITASMAVT